MNKLVICTVGTSIANGCPIQKSLFKTPQRWDADPQKVYQEVNEKLQNNNFMSVPLEKASEASAELTSLYKLGLTQGDKIVLLSTDDMLGYACANMVSKCLQDRFDIAANDIIIKRIEDLQVQHAQDLREKGLKNLITTLLSFLDNVNYSQSYDIILNPTGGYKGIVPFLVVMGMLFKKKNIYIFEFAKELITLPPLPFSFDLVIYNRVHEALQYLESQTEVYEQAFFTRIKDYDPEEHDFFSSFIEPTNHNGMVTLSPLAFCLLKSESSLNPIYVSENVLKTIDGLDFNQKQKIIQFINNLKDPILRNSYVHNFINTDLTVYKKTRSAERCAGFMKNGRFCVALVFTLHTDYERDLPYYSKADFDNVQFKEWDPSIYETNETNQESMNREDYLQQRLDEEIERNKHLESRIKELEQKLAEKSSI